MNDVDILNKLASNLTTRTSSAALSNYEILCNNISFSHDLLQKGKSWFRRIVDDIGTLLEQDDPVQESYRSGKELNAFTLLVPSMLSNDLEAIEKISLYTEPDDRQNIGVENVSYLHKGFVEYNNLVTATRQLIDSLVADAYQIEMLDPKEFNYHVLVSLNSFEKYATESIRRGLFNDDVEDALADFRSLNFGQWKNSSITKCQQPSFGNKVDYLFSALGRTSSSDSAFVEEIKNLFKFSSEFAHIGYISTFFTSQPGVQPVFGGDNGPYLLSTENYSELKYQILETCIKFIYMVYLPSVKKGLEKMFLRESSKEVNGSLDNLIVMLESGLSTRNNNYFFFVCDSLIGSSETIELPCICGHVNYWRPPHEKRDLYCTGCGSSYTVLSVAGDPGFIITSNGPAKVIGSSAPDFEDLPVEKQRELMRQVNDASQEGSDS